MKKWMALLLLAASAWFVVPQTTFARLPYSTFYYDGNQSTWFRIQPIYTPEEAFSAHFEEPVDLYVAPDDSVYVADKKQDRIIVLGNDGKQLRAIGDEEGKGRLSSPEGVFVTPGGLVYVADSGNQRIAVFGTDGKFVREYKKPDTTLMATEQFVPIKLVVDRRGVMYIALNSSYQGLVRLNDKGEFMGYFGANKAQQSLLTWLKKLVLNKEQLAKEKANLPRPIANIALDEDGFIYTATAGSFGEGAVRKLNAGGVDAFKNKTFVDAHGIVDVAIDKDGFLYNIDLDSEQINLYDRTGQALFAFGLVDKETQQSGVLGFPTSIGVDSRDSIWISDSKTETIHKFVRTEFGNNVLKALVLYSDGKYEESKPYWERVYELNDMYNGTFEGLGKVYLHEGDNHNALTFMKTAFDTEGYSKAFWQIRLDWMQSHFIALIAWIVGILLALRYGIRGVRALLRKHSPPASWNRPLADLRSFWYVMFHPYDGFYRLKEARVAPWIVLLLLAAAVGVKLASIYGTGFLFHPVELSEINLRNTLGLFVLPWITWIIANYLVCSVKDGEGKFREVVQGSTYALAPYFFFSIPTIVLSNIVTLDEKIVIHTLNTVMMLWMAAMFFVMTQVIHNFDFVETIKNSAITVLTIGMIWLFGFITFGLSYNLYDFFYQLYKEVSFYH
ncbi:YIP1 family protein [Cohnella zeiphila]|uniref:YIP1 family protein n=1 Tax=Cohnella zeiphila TaxID=2761120 RepID=A0A7X0SGJ4_9BACL|nr:YIP1 family protein [Cohnella zeiphila]MBB6729553.1 YIP1 family protein [Cohnella zeiphila]